MAYDKKVFIKTLGCPLLQVPQGDFGDFKIVKR